MSYRPRVYTASKIHHYTLWRKMKEDPDWNFVDWTASWVEHKDIGKENDGEAIDDRVFRHAWIANINDVRDSDFVLLYCGKENGLKGALIEAGAAIGMNCPVVAVGLPESHSWALHPLVWRFPSLAEARLYLFRFTVMIPKKQRKSENE
jgi:hypothetical protein